MLRRIPIILLAALAASVVLGADQEGVADRESGVGGSDRSSWDDLDFRELVALGNTRYTADKNELVDLLEPTTLVWTTAPDDDATTSVDPAVEILESQETWLRADDRSVNLELQDPVPFFGGWAKARVTITNETSAAIWVVTPEDDDLTARIEEAEGDYVCNQRVVLVDRKRRFSDGRIAYVSSGLEERAKKAVLVPPKQSASAMISTFVSSVCKPGRVFAVRLDTPWLRRVETRVACPPQPPNNHHLGQPDAP